jgi:SAM-dependent methyltransferase
MNQLRDAYFAATAPRDAETGRLRQLDGFYAAQTQAWLEDAVAFRPAMKILEAGAGSGGMLTWFARKTGPDGDVLGLDIDLSRAAPATPPVRHLQADLYAPATEPETFDLVYARLVLMHLPDPARAITALSSWLKPGGVLAIADLDCSTCMPADMDAPGASEFATALDAIRAAMQACALMDPAFGARLPALIGAAGFESVVERRFERIVEGGCDWAAFMAHNNTMIAPSIGAEAPADIVSRHMLSPDTRFNDQTLVCVTAHKPASDSAQ